MQCNEKYLFRKYCTQTKKQPLTGERYRNHHDITVVYRRMHTYIGTDNAVSTKTSTEKENSGLLGDYLHRETVRHWVSTLSSTTRSHGELCCCISLTVELGCAPGKKYCEPNNITLSGRDLSGLLASVFS